MLAVKSMDVRENFKDWCNWVINGETLIVSRSKNEFVDFLFKIAYNKNNLNKRRVYPWLLQRQNLKLISESTLN